MLIILTILKGQLDWLLWIMLITSTILINADRIPWLKLVNILFLQWFFVRLTRCQQKVVTGFEMFEVSILPDGCTGLGGRVTGRALETWYSLQGWIAPFKGIINGTSFPTNTWFVRISKIKRVCLK